MTEERWLPVPGWEGFYEVSDQGRVRSLDREVVNSKGVTMRFKGKIMIQQLPDKGYYKVNLAKNSKLFTRKVHRLVIEAFLGPCPSGYEVCHGDKGHTDNCLLNLRYGTKKDNHADKWRDGTAQFGPFNSKAKLTEQQAIEILRLKGIESDRYTANRFGVSRSCVSFIRLGRNWKYLHSPEQMQNVIHATRKLRAKQLCPFL